MPSDSEPSTSVRLQGRILAVVNQKGGVGKTTTAVNLAACLALDGQQILLIDLDPQANTSGGLGIGKGARQPEYITSYDLLVGAAHPNDAILPTDVQGLSLIPGSKNLAGANIELVDQDRREFKLRELLSAIRHDYNYILIDCPPALDLLTLNALVAADGLLVPVQAEYYALEGISELISTLDRVAQAFNPDLTLEGVILTMYDDRTNLSQQVTQTLRQFFGEKLLKTTIPRNIRLAEAPSHGKPAALYDPKSRGSEAYAELARELLALRTGKSSDLEKEEERTK